MDPRAEIAAIRLLWPDRVKMGLVSAGAIVDALGKRWQNYAASLLPGWPIEDITHYTDFAQLGAMRAGSSNGSSELGLWVKLLLDQADIKLRIVENEIVVDLDCVQNWLWLIDRYDQDAMICRWLVGIDPIGSRFATLKDIENLDWGMAVRATDRDLDMILSRGVADMHVHFSGVRSSLVQWYQCVDAELSELEGYLERLKKDHVEEGLQFGVEMLCELKQDSLRRDASGSVFKRMGDADPSELDEDELGWLQSRMAIERFMLIRCWHEVARGEAGHSKEIALAQSLDQYVAAKSLFLQGMRQTNTDGNPGLAAFRSYILKDSSIAERRRSGRWRRVLAGSAHRDYLRVIDYVLQSQKTLRRIELRHVPYPTAANYSAELSLWHGVIREKFDRYRESRVSVNRGQDRFEFESIRYAIHMSRSRDDRKGGGGSDRGASTTFERGRRKKFDEDTATLARFRATSPGIQGERILSPALYHRIDVAGQERDLKPHAAFFAIKLLKGDREALKQLNAGANCDPDVHCAWMDLVESENLDLAFGLPELGVSCHAGEDFGHPLVGISWVHSAITGLDMRAGDTIGHALALGWDMETFDRERRESAIVPLGDQFDALLWLHWFATRRNLPKFTQYALRIEGDISLLCHQIYGIHVPAVAALYQLIDLRSGPCLAAESAGAARSNFDVEHIYRLEIGDTETEKKRDKLERCDKYLCYFNDLVSECQQEVIKVIRERGVIIEINPSSNLRMSRTRKFRDATYLALVEALGNDGLVAINTDNPGIYNTRIEQEYAIVYKGLRDRDWTRADAMSVIEKIRQAGLEGAY